MLPGFTLRFHLDPHRSGPGVDLDVVITIVSGLLLLTLLVVSHEFGHFIVGKTSGIQINEFSVGFGPKIFSKIKKGIRYSIRCLPLGGYVMFHGEDEDIPNDPWAFNNAPIKKRALTIAAGPVFNLIFAVLITVVLLMCFGDYTPSIHSVENGMPAQEAGLREGDRIVELNGTHIDFMMEFNMAFLDTSAKSVEIGVERGGEVLTYDVPFKELEDGTRRIGITYTQERHYFGFFESFALSFKWMWLIIVQMFQFLAGLITTGAGAGDVAGPVGTISIIGMAIRSGPETVMRIASLLSINLAIMNLLPLPALDGGRLVLLGVEAIRKKPLPRNREAIINLVGLVLLFGLMALLTYQDIARLISG